MHAGAIMVGKTNMDQFAAGLVSASVDAASSKLTHCIVIRTL